MGRKPSPKHTLDRIDVNGDYEPTNCRWATPLEQGRNTNYNIWIEYKGVKMIQREWIDFLQINSSTLWRLKKTMTFGEIVKKYSVIKNIDYDNILLKKHKNN